MGKRYILGHYRSQIKFHPAFTIVIGATRSITTKTQKIIYLNVLCVFLTNFGSLQDFNLSFLFQEPSTLATSGKDLR